MNPDKKYWAFISYSSKDNRWGRWLHKRLESYPIPKEFQGTELFDGAVLGKDLKPCFRDRDELSGSADLGPAIEKALNESRYLIVLCSTNSAKSEWVNKEIEDFKKIGGEGKILALILEGEPNSGGDTECFPPALRYPAEPLAGDMRKDGDGKERGFLKVISGIAQLDFDDLYKRHERAQRKKRIKYSTVATSIITILIALSFLALSQKERADKETKRAKEQTQKVTDANTKQDKLLSEKNYAKSLRSFEAGRRNEGLAYLDRALDLHPQNIEAKITAINHLWGTLAPHFITNSIFTSDHHIVSSEFILNGKMLAVVHENNISIINLETKLLSSLYQFNNTITCASSPLESRFIATGSQDKTTRIIEISTGNVISSNSFDQPITDVELSPNGRWLAVTSEDGKRHIIDSVSGEVISSIQLSSQLSALIFSPDSKSIAVSESDSVKMIDLDSGSTMVTFRLPSHRNKAINEIVSNISFNPSGNSIAISSSHGAIITFATSTAKMISSYNPPAADTSGFTFLSFSPDGESIVTGGPKGVAQIHEAFSGRFISSILFDQSLNSSTFSPDGRWVIIRESTNTAHLIEFPTGKIILSFQFSESISYATFSPDGRWLAIKGDDNVIKIFETHGGGFSCTSAPQSAEGCYTGIGAKLTFSPDGKWISTTGIGDTTHRVIEAETGRDLFDFYRKEGPMDYITAIDFSKNGKLIASGSSQNDLTVRKSSSGILFSKELRSSIKSMKFSPDGELIAFAINDSKINLADSHAGNITELLELEGTMSSMEFSPNGQYLVIASITDSYTESIISIVSIPSKKLLHSVEIEGSDYSVKFSPDGKFISTISYSNPLRIMEIPTGDNITIPTDINVFKSSVMFSPDSQQIAIGGTGYNYGDIVEIFDINSKKINKLATFDGGVRSLCYSPDGSLIAVGSEDKTARVIKSDSGELVSTIDFKGVCTSVSFSFDGRWIAAASEDKTVRIVDASTGGIVAILYFDHAIYSVSFSPDGKMLSVLGDEGTRTISTCWVWADEVVSHNFDLKNHLYNSSKNTFDKSGIESLTRNYPSIKSGKRTTENNSPLEKWIHNIPELRTRFPNDSISIRENTARRLITKNPIEAEIISLADLAPWHPLIPISLARLEKPPQTRDFLAGLTLKRLRDADPEIYSEEEFASYYAKSAEWMNELELKKNALETVNEAIRRNPKDKNLTEILHEIQDRME